MVTPGVISVEKWCGHGSAWVYDDNKDAWLEVNYAKKAVTANWTRIGGSKTHSFSQSHPKPGLFSASGKNNSWASVFRDSKIHNSNNHGAESSTAVVPGVCHAPDWCDHGSLFAYDWKTDCWLEINYGDGYITEILQRIG